MKSLIKTNKIFNIVYGSAIGLPCPANIRLIWNFGSLLGICLITQILTGLFLRMHYINNIDLAFFSVRHISRDVNLGWILRSIHANGARIFFICLYLHVSRGLYYGSFWLKETWIRGVTLLILVIATAFLGYVLPWGQISFWGATVITNLFSAIPFIGVDLVYWIWGGFAVENATLTRFFSLHFIMPFVILGLVIVHLIFLHKTGSSNPLGINRNVDKIFFSPYFIYKDLIGFIFLLITLFLLRLLNPWLLGDPENFIEANPLSTPIHIQPEWYFLFAYAILRSIPNKLGGVISLFAAILILYALPFINSKVNKRFIFYPINKLFIWILRVVVILLTWIGARPVERPYILIGQILTVLYFRYFFIWPYLINSWNKHL